MTTPTHHAPEYPAGSFEAPAAKDMGLVAAHIEALAGQPMRLRDAIRGLGNAELATRYRNWTVRQIVHHLADSTSQLHFRWRLALTDDRPTVAPYNETEFARLTDSVHADHMLSVTIFDATLTRLVGLAKAMSPKDFDRAYFHPQQNRDVPLWLVLAQYAWHGAHHTGQIEWLRMHYRW
ncbi:MAG: DinB family protein [Phycisphaerae bacterium]|nr:DinB family protein [Phycisphaerae bacterium]